MKRKIILASTSPRRHGLAQQMGLEFEIMPSRYEEDMTLKMSAKELVKTLSYGKAREVVSRTKKGIVIGCDTIVVFDGKKLGKPHTAPKAVEMLKSFSGKKVYVYSGVALIDTENGKEIQDCEVSSVHFRKMGDDEIRRYVATGQPLDRAGAFGMEGLDCIFVDKVNGCFWNILGFPVGNIYKNLKTMGVDIFAYEKWNGKK